MTLETGFRLGTYEILSLLGVGGMGEVYRARDTKLGREVALKVLPQQVAADPERLARFEREAHLLASLNHENIATLHAFDRDADAHFLVMELVEGQTLADRIAEGPMPLDETVRLFGEIAKGLEAAHESGVVHRDLKPANIKLSAHGRVKILDFGLAKAMAPEAASGDPRHSASPTLTAAATQRGEILGTAAYMAPEQARGGDIDKRADIWAFGACLFEALSGRQAFGEKTASDSMAAILTRDPDWDLLPAATPATLLELLSRSLQKDPHERLRDIGDARLELESALRAGFADATAGGSGPAQSARPEAPPGRAFTPRLLLSGIAVIAVIAVVLSVMPMLFPPESIIVVMDTTSPLGVYDPDSIARGDTNADELTRVLGDLPVRVVKETTSPLWEREHQVAMLEPNLVVVHLSAFVYPPNFASFDDFSPLSETIGEQTGATLRDLGENKIAAFFGYMAQHSPKTRFLVYSRGVFDEPTQAQARIHEWETRFPALEGRISGFHVQRDDDGVARWSAPANSASLRKRVAEILDLNN